MIEKFLRAKHWQIFIAIFIIPYSLQFLAMTITNNNQEKMMYFTPFIILVLFLGLFGWFWSIAIGLKERIPYGIKMKIKKFKIFLLIPMIYVPIVFNLFDLVFDNLEKSNGLMMGISFAIIFPLHILSIFGFLYSFYYVAKTYKTVELQKEVSFSDFAGDFFLLLFFPIGVWIIQPNINKMVVNDAH
ncbi:MAG: hypothetical protein R2757_21445 [Draconibacterium sp.]